MRIYQEGFDFLNSVDFAKARTRMSEIEDEIIGGKAGDALVWWRQVTRQREIEMVRNIYAYCRGNSFDTGSFLVGAAHKMGIVEEIERYASTEANLIDWVLAYDGRSS